jgi:hypothetical protein
MSMHELLDGNSLVHLVHYSRFLTAILTATDSSTQRGSKFKVSEGPIDAFADRFFQKNWSGGTKYFIKIHSPRTEFYSGPDISRHAIINYHQIGHQVYKV